MPTKAKLHVRPTSRKQWIHVDLQRIGTAYRLCCGEPPMQERPTLTNFSHLRDVMKDARHDAIVATSAEDVTYRGGFRGARRWDPVACHDNVLANS
jgi:hypothetical protein